MKRLITITCFLVGISLIEACCSCPSFPDPGQFQLTNLQSSVGWDSIVADSHSFQNQQVILSGDVSIVSNASYCGMAAYACSCDEPFPRRLDLVTMQVFSDRPYTSDENDEISEVFFDPASSFGIFGISDALAFQEEAVLNFNFPPEKKDTFSFVIRLIESSGLVHQTTTDPIVISP